MVHHGNVKIRMNCSKLSRDHPFALCMEFLARATARSLEFRNSAFGLKQSKFAPPRLPAGTVGDALFAKKVPKNFVMFAS